jgi:hypothetical protein
MTEARRATIDADCWIAISGVHQIALFAGRCYIGMRIRGVSREIPIRAAARERPITKCSTAFQDRVLLHSCYPKV